MARQANWFAKKVGVFRRQGLSFKEAVRRAKSGHHSSSSTHTARSSSQSHPSRRPRFRAIAGRVHVRRHPKLATQAVNVTSALIAFSNEIGQATTDFFNGSLVSQPQAALARIAYKATGVDIGSGSINPTQLTASVVTKVAGYGFNKIGKWFLRKMRM